MKTDEQFDLEWEQASDLALKFAEAADGVPIMVAVLAISICLSSLMRHTSPGNARVVLKDIIKLTETMTEDDGVSTTH